MELIHFNKFFFKCRQSDLDYCDKYLSNKTPITNLDRQLNRPPTPKS